MSLKLKIRTQFPALVTAASPLVLTKTGLTYAFSFDQNSLNLGGSYALLTNNLSDLASRYTAKDNLSIHGADVASAATINIEAATGDLVDVTGTTTITAITLSEGHERTVRFTGILTLTNGASLVLPGGANITTAAGDFAIFRGYAAGVVRCVDYSPAARTGTGSGVFATSPTLTTATLNSPTLVTPNLGIASATTINKVAFTAPASGATLTIPDGVTLTGPAASGVAMTLGNNEAVSGQKVFADGKLILAGSVSGTTTLKSNSAFSGTVTLPGATDTLVGKSTTDVLTNKTLDSAGTGNVLKVSGVTVSAGQYPGEPGTGSAAAGNSGEYVESVIASGSAVALTTSTAKTVTSITLGAGDWDVTANVGYLFVTSTSVTRLLSCLSLTTNTLDTTAGRANDFSMAAVVPGGAVSMNSIVQPYRFSLSGSTTIFLIGFATFTASTLSAYGIIRARRR